MIVPDGRTKLEKLKELLGNPEQTHLDLKASVDHTNVADKRSFVKTPWPWPAVPRAVTS